MEKLGEYITEILNENRKVYLPGLGTFEKERIPALFDENSNSFLAPSDKIILTNEKGIADLIIKAIAQAEGISEEESENELKKAIGSILLELNETGESTIPNFGNLTKEDDDGIVFIQDEVSIEALPLYKPVSELKLLSHSIPESELDPQIVLNQLFQKELDSNAEMEEVSESESGMSSETPNDFDSHPESHVTEVLNSHLEPDKEEEYLLANEDSRPKKSSRLWLWPVAALIVLISAAALWYFNPSLFEKKEEVPFTIIHPIEEMNSDELLSTDSLSPSDIIPLITPDSLSVSEENEVELESTPPKEPTITFEIIIGSFGKRSEAENYIENMRSKGYKLRILENQRAGTLFKISYGSFTDEAKAQLELNKVREDLAKEAWVYKYKNY